LCGVAVVARSTQLFFLHLFRLKKKQKNQKKTTKTYFKKNPFFLLFKKKNI